MRGRGRGIGGRSWTTNRTLPHQAAAMPGMTPALFAPMTKRPAPRIRLPRAICDALIDDAKLGGNARITIDLERQVVVRPNGEEIHFDVDPFRKHSLLNGLDDIGQTLQHAARIASYEGARRAAQPWLPTTMT